MTTLPALYVLVGLEADALAEFVEAEDEEQRQAALAKLDIVQTDIRVKAAGVAAKIREWEGFADICEAEERRFADRKRALRNRADSLKSYLLANLKEAGIQRIDTERFTLAVRQNPPAVQIVDESAIPGTYKTVIQEIRIAKGTILAHVKETGEAVPGTEITRGERLEIW